MVDLTVEVENTLSEVAAGLKDIALLQRLEQMVKKLLAPRRRSDGAPLINVDGLVVQSSSYAREGCDMGQGERMQYIVSLCSTIACI